MAPGATLLIVMITLTQPGHKLIRAHRLRRQYIVFLPCKAANALQTHCPGLWTTNNLYVALYGFHGEGLIVSNR